LGIRLGSLFKKPVVVTAMGSDVNVVFDRSVHGRIVNAGIIRKIMVTLQKADIIVAKSEYLRRKITQLGIPGKKVWVIKNGVSREKFCLLNTESKALDGERKTILYVGSLYVEKGLRELVKAVEILSKTRSDFSLAVIGDGPFKRELIDLVGRFRIGEFVKIEGQKDHEEIPGWMSSSHVLCLPSYNEGLPNVVLESVSCGRPVVASNVGGIPEIINDSELGLLVPPRSPEKLAEALEEALDKEWNYEAIAKSGARFHWENILSRFNELYNELI
jgi:glycosyltransferase involved in cell wall biosynthesis